MSKRQVTVMGSRGSTHVFAAPDGMPEAEAVERAIGSAITYHATGAGNVAAKVDGRWYTARVRREVRYHVEHIEVAKRQKR